MAEVATTDGHWWRREARSFVELFAAWGFAVAQPLLDLFGRGPEQFALRGASASQIVVFGVAITVLPAVALWLLEVVVGLVGARPRRLLHLGLLGVLVAAFAVQAARPLTTGPALLVLGLVVGGLACVAVARHAAARMWLAFAALAPLGFLGLFLLTSPTSELLADDVEAQEVTIGDPAPVVMVVLDELPLGSLVTGDGAIDAELYPNIARLADRSHWFRNTTTVTSTTWHAVPTILTGQVPSEGDGPFASSNPDSLFTLLGGEYDLRVTETISRMCPTSLCPTDESLGEVWRGLVGDAVGVMRSRLSFTRDADDPVTGFAELGDGEGALGSALPDLAVSQPDRFRSLIDGLDDDALALHYLHLLLPHVPYRYMPSGNVYDGPNPDLGRIPELDQWEEESWPVTLGRQRHLLQLRYVDSLIGVLLDELEASGLFDDALVVVTADHGISFQPGGAIRSIEGQVLDEHSTPDTLWVPLFVKVPGQARGTISDANVQSIDILPTIADVLDVDIPFRVDGRSAFGSPRTETVKPFYGNDVNGFGVAVFDPVAIDGPAGWTGVLERSVGRFLPAVGDPYRMWRIGPSPELVGRRSADVADRLVPVDARLLGPAAYDDVPASGTKPMLVRGRLDGSTAAGTPVAVVVNGVVAATGPAYREDGEIAFGVMIDDALLRAGSNLVEVYAVSPVTG